jgi:pimeloyl-ACP methyl ester carboxylesterase
MPLTAGIYYSVSELGQPGAQPIILVHGAGGSFLGWHNHIRRMPGYNIYALDLPGHGKSPGEGRQSLSAYARDIVQFMQAAGIYQATLMGHSLGGMISLKAVLDYPDRFPRLIMVNSAATCPIPNDIIQGLLNPLTGDISFDWLIDRLVGADPHSRWVEATRNAIEQTRRGVLYGDFIACQEEGFKQELWRVRAKTLICYGEKDRFFSPMASRQLANSIRHSSVVGFPEAGHLLPLEQPDALIAEILRFMNDL